MLTLLVSTSDGMFSVAAVKNPRLVSFSHTVNDNVITADLVFTGPIALRRATLAPTSQSAYYRTYFDIQAELPRRPKPVLLYYPELASIRLGVHAAKKMRIVFSSNTRVPEVSLTQTVLSSERYRLRFEILRSSPHQHVLARSQRQEHQGARAVVVLDPGHGGDATGARGKSGIFEKNVVLNLAKMTRAALRSLSDGRIEVLLTREQDVAMSLDERVQLANEAKADFFVSIHTNAIDSQKVSGMETYFLDNSSDRGTARVVERENEYRQENLFTRFGNQEELGFVLASLSLAKKTEASKRLAGTIHRSVIRSTTRSGFRHRDNGLKSDMFYVLWGVHAPSALLEVAYISSPSDEKRLRSDRFLRAVAVGLAQGIINLVDLRQQPDYKQAQRR